MQPGRSALRLRVRALEVHRKTAAADCRREDLYELLGLVIRCATPKVSQTSLDGVTAALLRSKTQPKSFCERHLTPDATIFAIANRSVSKKSQATGVSGLEVLATGALRKASEVGARGYHGST